MSQPPPMPPPLPLPPIAMPVPADARPASVRVLCIVGFVLSGLAFLAPFSTLASFALTRRGAANATTGPAAVDPGMAMQAVLFEGPMLGWTVASQAITVALGGWLLWASLAAWRMRSAGRRALLAYAAVMIAWTLVAQAVYFAFAFPRTFDAMSSIAPGGSAGVARVTLVASMAVGAAVALAHPICLLVFLRRPNVVAAYAAAGDRRG